MNRRRLRLAWAGALAVATALTGTPANTAFGAATAAPSATCFNTAVVGTVEEQRLTRGIDGGPAVPAQIMQRSGFTARVNAFRAGLCTITGEAAARAYVRSQGNALWRAAVARAQQADQGGTALPASDDRGLYWSRLSMALALRQWQPEFRVTAALRTHLNKTLEHATRGIDNSTFGSGVKKVVVTGFDPFTLDRDIRIGNPSGAIALSLDGKRWTANGQTYEIQTAIFPVRYTDFNQQIVEKALTRHYRVGAQQADLVMTVSQGGSAFDLEVFNGRRRSSITDNNNLPSGGTVSAPVVAPGMPAGPEWLRSTLPFSAMLNADVSPYQVRTHATVLEIPAGSTDPVLRTYGPTAGSIAVEGSGGGYLSNEIAYRNTLLRETYDTTMPAGHLHVPILYFASDNRSAITDSTYEANRNTLIGAAQAVVRSGLPR